MIFIFQFCGIIESDRMPNYKAPIGSNSLSHAWLFATLWIVAHQAPLSMGFSRQEYWSGLPFPSPGNLPNPGIESRSSVLQADALTSERPGKPIIIAFIFLKSVNVLHFPDFFSITKSGEIQGLIVEAIWLTDTCCSTSCSRACNFSFF